MKNIPCSTIPKTRAGFTLVEVMISMTVVALVMGMVMSTFLFCLRISYKDTQRLATNGSLRSFMAQVSKETLDSSYFYVFPYYTSLNGAVTLTPGSLGPVTMTQIEDAADNDYDKWVAHGDCLVLVTKTSTYRTTDIRQIRIYYRTTTNQATVNNVTSISMRYYETADWGEGSSSTSNGHTDLVTELNAINLNSNPNLTGTKQLSARTAGRLVGPSPITGTYPNGSYVSGDRYPVFSSESPDSSTTNGFISINMEFINGSSVNNLLSSSSFNYTISPRR